MTKKGEEVLFESLAGNTNSYRARHGRRRARRGPKLLEVEVGCNMGESRERHWTLKNTRRCPVRQMDRHRAVCSWGRVANRDSPITVIVIGCQRIKGIASGLPAGNAENQANTSRPDGIICFAGVAMPSCCNTRRGMRQGFERYLKTTSRLIHRRVWLPLD